MPSFVPAALLLALVLLCLLPARCAFTEVVVSITPARIPLHILPGSDERVEVTVTNQGDEPVGLLPMVMEVLCEGEAVRFSESEECAWFTPEGSRITLAAAETRSVGFRVSVPASAHPGDRRFALAFVQSPHDDNGIGITPGIAALLEMEVLPGGSPGSPAGGPWPLLWTVAGVAIVGLLATFMVFRRRRGGIRNGSDGEGGRGVEP